MGSLLHLGAMDRVQLEKLLMSSPGMVVGTAMSAVYVAHRLLGKKGWVQVLRRAFSLSRAGRGEARA